METNTEYIDRDFRVELIKALRAYSYELMELYKNKLQADDVRATGKLMNAIKPLSGEISQNVYIAGLRLLDYWKHIEYGRKPGKFPPPNAILNWVKTKPVTPRPYQLANGKTVIPTQQQLAFLIGRKIAREGIKPRTYLQESIDELQDLVDTIVNEVMNSSVVKIQQGIQTVKI